MARGIAPERILVESKSRNTYENLKFSRQLVSDASASVAVVSNDYHLFRGMALARSEFAGQRVRRGDAFQ